MSKKHNKFMVGAVTAAMVATAVAPAAGAEANANANAEFAFTDVSPESSHFHNIYKAYDLGIMKGYQGKFNPNDDITRGQVVKALGKKVLAESGKTLEDYDFSGVTPFNDVTETYADKELYTYSLIVKKEGIFSGDQNNLNPSTKITRQQMAKVLVKAFGFEDLPGDLSKVKDNDKATAEYVQYIDILSENGITTEEAFRPKETTKRAQFASFIVRSYETANPISPDLGDYKVQITTAKASLVADGADNTVVTVKIVDEATGAVATDADDIVVAFDSTFGSLANNRVTVQDGVASVVLTSEFSQKELRSFVTARIIETAAGSDWYDQIGLVGTTEINFVPATGSVDVNNMPLVSGTESNVADRVTVYFDRNVTPAMFYSNTNPLSVSISQPGESAKTIAGYKAVSGNSKAIEVILDKNTVLTDNKQVNVGQSSVNGGFITKSFILTDARQPEATSVKQLAYNQLEVTFSEPITDVQANQVLIDGGQVGIKSVDNGDFHATTGTDKRHTLLVTTTNFIPSGDHSIQLSGISDFAGESDPANISTNQILNFSVAGSNTVPAAIVNVESPEQVRVEFNTYVEDFVAGDVEFEVYDESTKTWVSAPNAFKAVTAVDSQEYVYEMNTDWTQYFNTSVTNDNYYNHQFRVKIAKDSFKNPANGKLNALQELSLNYAGSPLNNPDNTSPVISGTPTLVTDKASNRFGSYLVTFNEPVKLPGKDNAGNTPSQLQSASATGLPNVVVEFIGTDKDGKKVTVAGSVNDYVNSKENSFYVSTPTNLQARVDAGYAEKWTLVVRNVTDDVGNAATTLTTDFNVAPSAPPAPAAFKVSDANYDGVDFYSANSSMDQIVLDFTSSVSYSGTVENALNLSNYTLNGVKLPNGSVARLLDGDNNTDNGFEVVVIEVPNNTLLNASNTINISKSLKSATGLSLTGETEIAENIQAGTYGIVTP